MRKLAVLLLLALILLGSAAASPTVISALDARGQGHGGPTLGGDGGDDGPEIKPDMWATSLATKPSVAEAFKTTLAASQNKFADRRLSRRLMQGSAGPASFQFAEPAEYGGGLWKARIRAGIPVVRMNDKADTRFGERKPWGTSD